MTQLASDLTDGDWVAVTDGSFKTSHGTAAWKIVNPARPENAITSSCITPGHTEQIDAYQSELTGLYGTIATITLLAQYFQIPHGTVVLACDNLAAIQQASYSVDCTSPLTTANFFQTMQSPSIH